MFVRILPARRLLPVLMALALLPLPADAKPVGVRIFEHADFKGRMKMLGEGNYNIGALGIGNDVLSSIRVPQGWTVTLYEHANFRGRSIVVTRTRRFLKNFNDITSSIRVRRPKKLAPPRLVTIYEHADFKGRAATFSKGRYDMRDLRAVGNDRISSIRVPPGWRVTLFEHAGFRGRQIQVTSSRRFLKRFNDTTSSMIVRGPRKKPMVGHDGCKRSKQYCVCGNTQRAGFCGTGPHKAGLYCRCDRPMAHHDGCKKRNQRCRCGNTGWKGRCNTGPHKSGLYCRCD